MADALTFYTHPMTRGRIARWMLEEVGAPYETVVLGFAESMKSPDYLAINPLGKVPAIRHGDRIVTETAAICAYLADAFPEAGLAPPPAERADYYRWLFFAAGPIEAAITDKTLGVEVPPDKRGFVGYGSLDAALDTLESAVAGKRFVAGEAFSAADLYVAAHLGFGFRFGTIPKRDAFLAYYEPIAERPALKRANAIDDALLAEQQQPPAAS